MKIFATKIPKNTEDQKESYKSHDVIPSVTLSKLTGRRALLSCSKKKEVTNEKKVVLVAQLNAILFLGAVKMPFGIVGTLSGGAIMGRLKLNLRGASIMVFVVALLCAGCIVFNFFIGCKTRPVAGITAGLNQR